MSHLGYETELGGVTGIPCNVGKEPVLREITSTDSVNQIALRIQLGVPFPQTVLPKPAGKMRNCISSDFFIVSVLIQAWLSATLPALYDFICAVMHTEESNLLP